MLLFGFFKVKIGMLDVLICVYWFVKLRCLRLFFRIGMDIGRVVMIENWMVMIDVI